MSRRGPIEPARVPVISVGPVVDSSLRALRALRLIRLCGLCLLCATWNSLVDALPQPLTRYEFAEPHMGTEVRIVLYAPDAERARAASARAFARVAALDAVMSDYREDSEVMAICRRAGGGPIEASDDLFRVLREAGWLSRASHGAFDVTVGPLSRIWRRARRLGEQPDSAKLRAALDLVGADKMVLNETTRSVELKKPGMLLDLGGIGKGFAADEAAAVLTRLGIRSALVAVGGDIVVTGAPPDAAVWKIALAGARAETIPLHDAAISTSGDAEQWVELSGVRYSHIIDPRSGTAVTGRDNVTVVARTGVVADGLATAVSVLDLAHGLRLVDATPGAAARIAVAAEGRVRTFVSRRWPQTPRIQSATEAHGHTRINRPRKHTDNTRTIRVNPCTSVARSAGNEDLDQAANLHTGVDGARRR